MAGSPDWEPETATLGSSPWWVPPEQGPWAMCALGTLTVPCAHSGVIVGASASHHLLETSRVVFQV